jgi:membrane-bound ClpP family serine protease
MTETLLYAGIGLLAISILLIVVEAFIPSGGLIGTVAIIVAVAGLVSLFRYDLRWGFAGLLSVIVLGPSSFFFAMSLLPSTPFGRRLIGEATEEQIAERDMAERHEREKFAALVGREGVAITDLRPVGQVRIDTQRYEALAEGGLIDTGSPVRVTAANPSQIKVRAIRRTEAN